MKLLGCRKKATLCFLLTTIFLFPWGIAAQDKALLESLIIQNDGTVGAHDPTIVKEGDTYYRFDTGPGLQIYSSKDLKQWEFYDRVFQPNPSWIRKQVPGAHEFWAPEVVYRQGQWRVYYSVSTFGSNRSAIGLVTTKTLNDQSSDYKWTDFGMVIDSKPSDDFNAIDAFVVNDAQGQDWIGYGSFWSGIKLRHLNSDTGKLPEGDLQVWSIASRNTQPNPVEGGYIYHKDQFYYLFVSWDYCCRGISSTYRMAIGRSKSITGPYLDKDGKSMMEGGGTIIRKGDSQDAGVGHNSVLADGDKEYLVFHGYDLKDNGNAKLRIEQIVWSADGWPQSPQELLNQK